MRISIPVLIRSVYSIGSIKTKYDLGYATTFTNSSLLSTDSVETIHSSPKSRCQDLKKNLSRARPPYAGYITLKTYQSPVILDLCLRKTRSGKSRDYRDVIVFEMFRCQNVFRSH